MMFVLEMRARRKQTLLEAKNNGRQEFLSAKTRNFIEWLLGDLPSEYGTNWRRILYSTILVVLVFGLIYWGVMISVRWGLLNFGVFLALFVLMYFSYLWYSNNFENIQTLKELILGIRYKQTLSKVLIGTVVFYGLYVIHHSVPISSSLQALDNATIKLSDGRMVAPDGTPGSYFGTLLNALYYSLVTFTTLGYGDIQPTGWLKALSAIEALTGAVFMALIVAVIARKWMR